MTLAPPAPVGGPATTAGDGSDAGLAPASFAAVTVQVYVWPLSSPLTSIGEPVSVALLSVPPSLDVQSAVYCEIARPPSYPGGENDTVMSPSPGRTPGRPGASGATASTSVLSESGDAGEVPAVL